MYVWKHSYVIRSTKKALKKNSSNLKAMMRRQFLQQLILFLSGSVLALHSRKNLTRGDIKKPIVACYIEPLYLDGDLAK